MLCKNWKIRQITTLTSPHLNTEIKLDSWLSKNLKIIKADPTDPTLNKIINKLSQFVNYQKLTSIFFPDLNPSSSDIGPSRAPVSEAVSTVGIDPAARAAAHVRLAKTHQVHRHVRIATNSSKSTSGETFLSV